DHARQVSGPEAGIERAHAWPGLPEDGALGGDRQVAEEVKHVAATDRVAVDRGDHRFRDLPDQTVQVLDLEKTRFGRAVVPGLRTLFLVAARGKRAIAGAGEGDYPDVAACPCALETANQL